MRRPTPSKSRKLLQPASTRQRLARIFAIFAATVGLCVFFDGAFNFLERFADNLRLTSYAQRNGTFDNGRFDKWAKSHIVVVTRSDDSFEDLRGQSLPRSYHAKLIRDLTRAGVKVIAFDFTFATSKPEDDEFAAAARASGRVVWAAAFQNGNDDSSPTLHLPTPKLLHANPYYGHIGAPIDEDVSQVTRIPAVIMDGQVPVPAFSLQITRRALGLQDAHLRHSANVTKIGSMNVPTARDGSFLIKYLGTKPGDVFPAIPYEQIYNGAVDQPFYRDNHFFKDKIIIIGDVTSAGNDHRPTPLGEMAGVEIHAHAVATLMQGSFFYNAPAFVNLALIVFAAALICPIAANWRAQWAALATFLLLFSYLWFNLWIFADHEISLHLVAPSVAMLLAALGVMAERSLTVERDKYRAQGLLQRYVSPQIANYVLQHPDKCVLGGARIHATVLFSDIRGFTAMSEKLTPEEVLERLNEYFEAMTQQVFKHDGTVDKYIGDAIMAIFGAPLPHEDHARRAVATAIDMQTALLDLQERWKAQGLPLIDIGIGINTGDMVFGNMGAKDRMDFSVLGDAVNLASRVESLTKEMKSRILITASTYELVKDEVEARGPLTATVKGKEEEVTVYAITGWQTAQTQEDKQG